MSNHILDATQELPPSAKLVIEVLEYNDTLTQGQIAEQALLPDRTVWYTLNHVLIPCVGLSLN